MRMLNLILCVNLLIFSCTKAATANELLLRFWKENHQTPEAYVTGKFSEKKWIFIGEYHRVKHDVDLVCSLIPLLHEKTDVRLLALEFLQYDQTDTANALITSSQYNPVIMRSFFRKQFPDWAYEEYLNIFKAAWESNMKHSATRGEFRLVGLHPGVNWEVMNYGTDQSAIKKEKEKLSRYDELMAEHLEAEVLKKGLKALVFTGIAHCTGKFTEYRMGTDPPEPLLRMGNMVYRDPYGDEIFFICLHAPFFCSFTNQDIYPFDGELDRLMKSFKKDIGFDVVGTPFETLGHKNRSRLSITNYNFGQLYDGYIIFKTPIKEYDGVTYAKDWISSEEEFYHYWRNLPNKEASIDLSGKTFAEFKRDFCYPDSDHGITFRRRFRSLPDL